MAVVRYGSGDRYTDRRRQDIKMVDRVTFAV